MKRIIVIGVGVLVVVVVAAVLLLYSSLNSIIEQAIESYGTELTGTSVRLDSVDLSASSGQGVLRGLTVANPEGFADRDVFSLDEISVTLDVTSLTSNPVIIEEVRIDSPRIFFEMNKEGKSNIDMIRKRVESQQAPKSEGESEVGGEATRLIIRKFTLSQGQVDVDAEAYLKKSMTVDLKPVQLTNLGGEQGMAPSAIGKEILIAVSSAAARSVASEGLGQILDEKLGGKAGGAAKKLLDSIFK